MAVAAVLLAGCAGLATRPLPPKVEVEGIRVVVTAVGETRFRVLLAVTNPNAYAVAIQSVDAQIRVEDQDVASAGLANPVSLAAAGETHLEVEARPDFAALSKALERMLRKLAGHYEVAGHAIVQDGMRLEFRKQGDLPLGSLLGRLK